MHSFDEELAAQNAIFSRPAVTFAEGRVIEFVESVLPSLGRHWARVVRISLRVVVFETCLVQDRKNRSTTVAAELFITQG